MPHDNLGIVKSSFFCYFCTNSKFMPQQTSKDIAQAVPLTEFVDSVFVELERWESEDSPCYYSAKKRWNDTLIPLAVHVYELAKSNDEIFWWLLQKMSRIELCKDGREFRKTDLFDVLTRLKHEPDRLKMVLKNCQLSNVEDLQIAIEEGDINSFRSTLNQTDGCIFDVGRVLRRTMAIGDIYKSTVNKEGIETLAALFWLIRRSLLYFAESSHRSCDGMAYTLFVALNISMYREYAIDFCDLLTQIGSLWVDSLMMNYLSDKDQYPQAVSQAVYKTLHDQYSYGFDKLKEKYDYCDNDEQVALLREEHDGCLKLEEYSFVYVVLESGPFFPPPFDWKKWRPGGVRIMKRRPEEYRYPITDHLLSDWIPMEELVALRAQEAIKNDRTSKPVVVSDYDSEPAAKGKGHGVKDKTKGSVNEFKPMWFPSNIAIKSNQCKRFLEILHSKLCSSKFLKEDSKCDFVFIFGGMDDDTNNHHPVDWQDDDKATLKAFCSAFYDMPNMRGRKPWSKLTVLFTCKGEPIGKLSENANEVYRTDLEDRMKRLIDSAIADFEKEI